MKIVGLDTETTGLLSTDHRLIEVYAGCWDLDSRKLVAELNLRINPERSIAAEAQRVHGISMAQLTDKPTWNMVAPEIRAFLDGADLLVAHNGKEFDLPFINQEMKRIKLDPIERPLIDTMLEGRWACHDGKVPNLGELCFACDVPYDTAKAHAADYDVKVMMECFFRALDWGFFNLPVLEESARAEAA